MLVTTSDRTMTALPTLRREILEEVSGMAVDREAPPINPRLLEFLLRGSFEPAEQEHGDKQDEARPHLIDLHLAELVVGARAFETANAQDKEHYERLTRMLGLAVVALTAVTGTAIVTTLATSASMPAKVVVGILGVAAAVVAAVNEKGPFTDQSKVHADAESLFGKLHTKAKRLERAREEHPVETDEAERQFKELEDEYDALKDSSPDVRNYERAHGYAEREEQELWHRRVNARA